MMIKNDKLFCVAGGLTTNQNTLIPGTIQTIMVQTKIAPSKPFDLALTGSGGHI